MATAASATEKTVEVGVLHCVLARLFNFLVGLAQESVDQFGRLAGGELPASLALREPQRSTSVANLTPSSIPDATTVVSATFGDSGESSPLMP